MRASKDTTVLETEHRATIPYTASLNAVSAALAEMTYARGTNKAELHIHTLQIFLAVASRPGISMQELERAVPAVTQAAISRTVGTILGPGKPRAPGLNWIRPLEDPEYLRRKLVYLTSQGEQVATRVAAAVERVLSKEK